MKGCDDCSVIGGERRIVVCDWSGKEDCSVIGGEMRIEV